MSIRGWVVGLSSHSYSTPNMCASCCGPRETEVTAKISEKTGNIRTTLTMAFPYCRACGKRASFEKLRQGVVLTLAALLGGGLSMAAWAFDAVVVAPVRFAILVPAAIGISALLAFVIRQSQPAEPATARGEAIILRDTSGTVLCTSQKFAEVLAQANGTTAKPGSQWFTVEVWAPITAALLGILVLVGWFKVGMPSGLSVASDPPAVPAATATSTAAPASTTPPAPIDIAPKKPVVPAHTVAPPTSKKH